jgi:regulatory protein
MVIALRAPILAPVNTIRMEITAIRRQKRREDRVTVHLEGEHRVILSVEIVARAGLRRGISITAEQLASLVEEDSEIRAREAALRLLGHRARSRAGLRRSLARRGFEAAAVDACVARLESAGLLDDRAFATAFVAERVRTRPRGIQGLRADLNARGIDHDTAVGVITEVLAESGASELDLAVDAARKFRRKAGEAPVATRRRLQGYLARRGFSAETISRYVTRWKAGGPESN